MTGSSRLIIFWILVATGCGQPTLNIFDPDLGILGHWPLDVSTAGTAEPDTSGFGHDGTPSANPPTPTRDVPRVHFGNPYGLTFNGKDQWIDLGNPRLLDTGGPMTLAAWIRPADNGSAAHDILAHGYHNGPDAEITLRVVDGLYSFVFWDGTDHGATTPIPPADLGTWVHLCGVFDGATYSLYRDGALVASTADGTAPTAVQAPWSIGARVPNPPTNGGVGWAGPDRLFLGDVDDVRIYGRPLGAAEVEALARR